MFLHTKYRNHLYFNYRKIPQKITKKIFSFFFMDKKELIYADIIIAGFKEYNNNDIL